MSSIWRQITMQCLLYIIYLSVYNLVICLEVIGVLVHQGMFLIIFILLIIISSSVFRLVLYISEAVSFFHWFILTLGRFSWQVLIRKRHPPDDDSSLSLVEGRVETRFDYVVLVLVLVFQGLLWNIYFPIYCYRCWVLHLSHFIIKFFIFHFVTWIMAYTLTDSFSFNPFCQHSSLLTSSIFVPLSSIHLLKFLSNITPIFTFFTHQYKAESASFLPKQPSLWFFWRDRPPAFLYIMSSSFLSHSCLTNIETWPTVRLHTLSQDFYLSDDLISFLECLTWWVPLGESPWWSRRPYSKCFELLRQVRYPLISHSGSLHLFGRS